MEESLIQTLIAAPSLSGLLAGRIYWNKRPQGSALPALVLHKISPGKGYTMKGAMRTTDPLVQMDCIGLTYGSVKAVERGLIAAFGALAAAPFQGAFIEGGRETVEPSDSAGGESEIQKSSLDVRVWHSEP